jgi:hypothetical protein
MWYHIKKGRNRASPLRLGIHFGKTSESYEVIFDESCRYDLVDEDQEDWNKLTGWSYGLHHQNSVRLGWKYNSKVDKILVCRYIYENGIRREEDITEYEIGIKHTMRLSSKLIPKWGYTLGLFFGGNKTAPHNMKIYLKRIK